MTASTLRLRLNPWQRVDVEHGKEPEQFDFGVPRSDDPFDTVNLPGVFLRLSPGVWEATGRPVTLDVTIAAVTTTETGG